MLDPFGELYTMRSSSKGFSQKALPTGRFDKLSHYFLSQLVNLTFYF